MRAVCTPLMIPISFGDAIFSVAEVEKAACMLKLVVGAQWAIAKAAAHAGSPLKATSGLLSHAMRLISLLADVVTEENTGNASPLLRHHHAVALRTAGVGLLANISLDVVPPPPPTYELDSRGRPKLDAKGKPIVVKKKKGEKGSLDP